MKNTKHIAIILVLLLIPVFSLSGCVNSERKQQKILDTFSSFENESEYVFVTWSPDELHIRENVIDLASLSYEGRLCSYISTATKCAYFYAYSSELKNEVDLLSLSYQTLELSLVDTIAAEDEITRANYYNGEVYFTLWNKDAAPSNSYLIYSLETTEVRNADYNSLSSDVFSNFQSEKYTIWESNINNPFLETKLLIKNEETGEEKTIGRSLFKTCEAGENILNLGPSWKDITRAVDYYEYNGDIYIVYIYLTDGFLGYPCNVFVMKYDFESHTMQYYTSVLMDGYPEGGLSGFRIPE